MSEKEVSMTALFLVIPPEWMVVLFIWKECTGRKWDLVGFELGLMDFGHVSFEMPLRHTNKYV